MKKIILSGLLIGSCLMLASCGTTSEDAAIKNLATQVDKLNNVVANVSVVDTKAIDLSTYSSEEDDNSAIRNIYQKTKTSIDKQNDYKSKILEKTANIKKSLAANELKIGNKNIKAMRELSNTLSKYTTKLANTNNEYKKTANSISKLKNGQNTSTSVLGAKLTRLSSCADSRSCYYNNILNTLSQIEVILNNGTVVEDNNLQNNLDQNNFNQDTNDMSLYNNCDNGVCYDKDGNVMNGSYFDENGNLSNGNSAPNSSYVNQNYNNQNYNNTNKTPNNDNNIYRNRHSQNNNNPNYNYYRNNGFNPDRNTDTYAPNISNIDTYKNNGGYGNYANMTEGTPSSLTTEETKNDTKDIKENPKQDNELVTLEEKVETLENAIKDTSTEKDLAETKPQTTKINLINMNEDGKNDINPRTKNLRYAQTVEEKQQKDTSTTTEKTLQISQDYKSSNRKIKELVQTSSTPDNMQSFFNVI